ncbi:MAG: 4-alpha-glucanotransferase [Patescibacteria group bacterium]
MKRSSGILLHPTCLPSPYGLGDFGSAAFQFVDFLEKSGQKIWEILPLNIPDDYDNIGSPYASSSAMAGNWLLISPEKLVKDNLLAKKDLPPRLPVKPAQYDLIKKQRLILLKKSYEFFYRQSNKLQKKRYLAFQKKEKAWLSDYAFFMALKDHFRGRPWSRWPKPLANRDQKVMSVWQKKLDRLIDFYKYEQWIFFGQWLALKKYANQKGVKIFGDLPFFVILDSVDVWANRKLFLLNRKNRPFYVGGVPPDYFSRWGQIWNNPQYDWKAIQKTRFAWQVNRFQQAFRLYDLIRVDHFRGYQDLWFIKYGRKDGRLGRWVKVPGDKLFYTLRKKLGRLPIVAEDLGLITPEVIRLREKFKFPGMRVMLFGFSGEKDNFHFLPNFPVRGVAYTGNHDTDTARGWLEKSSYSYHRKFALKYLKALKTNFTRKLIEAGLKSKIETFITPLQDFLDLGAEARFNRPATNKNNWRWRCPANRLTPALAGKIKRLTRAAGR